MLSHVVLYPLFYIPLLGCTNRGTVKVFACGLWKKELHIIICLMAAKVFADADDSNVHVCLCNNNLLMVVRIT